MELVKQFLASTWDLFQRTPVPGLNLNFAQLWLGVFVVGISIVILRPLLGIGFGTANNIVSGAVRAGKRGYDRSYSKYRRTRERNESFAKRYKEEHKQ